MTAPVFISYSSKDRGITETICGALENRGITCWMSSRDIGPGENFQESIIRAIRTASAMVIVFSGNSNNSDEVKKEVALAGQHKLVVVPVRVEDVVPAEAFQYELATRQWIDMFGNWEHAIERLAIQIRTILAGKAAHEAAAGGGAAETAKPVIATPMAVARPQRSSALPLTVAAVALIAATVGGVYWWKTHRQAQDNAAWSAAELQNSIDSYQGYLQDEPKGTHADEADLRIDGLEWEAAMKLNTIAGYETYKQIEAQHGRHLADADNGIAKLNATAKAAADAKARQAAASAQQAAVTSQQAPAAGPQPSAGGQQADAAEEADFKRALDLHTSAEDQNFLAAHGGSTHVAEIRQRLASCQMVKSATGGQTTPIQVMGKGTGAVQFQACQSARQDGRAKLDAECPGGALTGLRNQRLSFTPADGCVVKFSGTCTAHGGQGSAERCR
ncbi:MAG TPA: toll/interleukin-1 receptor domain-containing protein [Alphaproteobacteria bacterium]|nr:toll/interleukin-1 receptor domain-containing protein [Alphaproteobacteria bacterium]